MKSLPRFLRLNDARSRKWELLASLTEQELLFVDAVASGGRVYGSRPGVPSSLRVVVSKGRSPDFVVAGAQPTLTRLAHGGWLRFAPGPVDPDQGYFWLTQSAERLWRVLGREVR